MNTEIIPDHRSLWFLPLGGCGEIGMNLNLYGHDRQWLMVDCGITFEPGRQHEVILPDPTFIRQRRQSLCGMIITHAHEDHIGAVPYLWPQLDCPIYTTPFTAEILRRKLASAGLLARVTIIEVNAGEICKIGPFNVEWLRLTHSIPEPNALIIRTPAGHIFHTADWKLDPSPIVGPSYDRIRLQQLANENIRAMVCDSTNALVPGHSVSESTLYAGLKKAVVGCEGRVFVGCFGSNIARLLTLARIAQETGRYMCLLGRSLQNMVAAAKAQGLWPNDFKLIEPSHAGYLPAQELLAVATGSQGEPRTALWQLANGRHPALELEPGDTVIFSARTIPGNEPAVARLQSALKSRSVHLVTPEHCDLPIHASGHPCQDELRQMYQWVRPHIAIPVHGEAAHMAQNASIARACHVPYTLTGTNGDLFLLEGAPRCLRKAAPVGRLLLTPEGRLQSAPQCSNFVPIAG